jgi:transcriptional regulator with XRE-family HTH domain
MSSVEARIKRALARSGLSQRTLAEATGISQPTLSRISSGERAAKMPELVAIAAATGCTVAELSSKSVVGERVQSAARATQGASMDAMRRELVHYLELDAYLDDQGIPVSV